MKRRLDLTSAIAGCLLAGALCLALGATRSSDDGNGRRFHIACTDSSCYLVDGATGQVWNPHKDSTDFYMQKLGGLGTYATKRFVGQWKPDDNQDNMTVGLEATGRAVLIDSEGVLHAGQWRVFDHHIVVDRLDGERQLMSIIWDKDSEKEGRRMVFRKVK